MIQGNTDSGTDIAVIDAIDDTSANVKITVTSR